MEESQNIMAPVIKGLTVPSALFIFGGIAFAITG
jgi:hypothetical protein